MKLIRLGKNVTQLSDSSINPESLEIQIQELLRLEFDITEDIEKQKCDLKKVQEQRELLETQLRLITEKQLGQEQDNE
jgi:hypothetical protein